MAHPPFKPGNPGRFPPGKSGNPSGRNKAAAEMARIIAKETQSGAELVAFALAVMRGATPAPNPAPGDGAPAPPAFVFANVPTDPRSRVYAHEWLTDRLAGKAPQDLDVVVGTVELTPQQMATLEALKMSPHERRQRIEELRAQAQLAASGTVTVGEDGSGDDAG